jgi:N-acetylmuramic acid 6-phosphate etherase
MSTESRDPRFEELDSWSADLAIGAMVEGQLAAVAAVAAARPALAAAVEAAAARLRGTQGRLVYVGAGTSGRIAVQDGVELHPTYGWPWSRMAFCMAGGEVALMHAVENAEDDAVAGAGEMDRLEVGADDVVICVAASGRTPYTLGALRQARARGALTLAIASNADSPLLGEADCPVFLDTGREPVAGSTRMKAGTAQKVALNLWSTALMVQLGEVYRGRMVGMKATNAKLRVRAVKMVAELAGCSEAAATSALDTAGGDIKHAVLVAFGHTDAGTRAARLRAAGGSLRRALALSQES